MRYQIQGRDKNDRKRIAYCVEINAAQPQSFDETQGQAIKGGSEMKNLLDIRKERKDALAYWTVGDLLEPEFAKARVIAIASVLEDLDEEEQAIVRG